MTCALYIEYIVCCKLKHVQIIQK